MVKREPNFQELFKEEDSNNVIKDNEANIDKTNENEEAEEIEETEEYEVYEDYPSFFEYLQLEAIRFKDKIIDLIPRRDAEYEYVEEEEYEEDEYEYEEDDSQTVYMEDNDKDGGIESIDTDSEIHSAFTVEPSTSVINTNEENNELEEEKENKISSSHYTKVVKSDTNTKVKYDLDSEICKYYIRIYRVMLCIILSIIFVICNVFFTGKYINKSPINVKEEEVEHIYVGDKPLSASPLGSYYINYPTKSIGTLQRYYALDILSQKYKLGITKETVIDKLNKYSFVAKQTKIDKDDLIAQTKYELILEKLIEKKIDKVKIPKDIDAKLKANEPTYRLSVRAYKCKDINEGKTLINKDNIHYNQAFQFSSKDETFVSLIKMLLVSDYGVVKEPVKLGNNYYVIEYIKKELITDDATEQYKKEQAKLKVFAEMREITDKHLIHYMVDKGDKKKNKK